jgi:hypothetical protein
MWYRNNLLPSAGLVPERIVAGWVLLSQAGRLALEGVPDLVALGEWNTLVYTGWAKPLLAGHEAVASNALVGCALAAGIGLVLGALTRPAALLGTLVCLAVAGAASSALVLDAALLTAAACAGCAVSPAGLRFGLDAFLVGRVSSLLTWTQPEGIRVIGSRSHS